MSENETVSAVTPLLRHRNLRIAIIAAPAITSTVAILTSQESNLAAAIVLNVLAGIPHATYHPFFQLVWKIEKTPARSSRAAGKSDRTIGFPSALPPGLRAVPL